MIPMQYTVVLQREEDGGYVAKVPSLRGCVSQGDTWDEAMANIQEAAELYEEDCIAMGHSVATPALGINLTPQRHNTVTPFKP